MHLQMENEKVRVIPHAAVAPLAVSGKSCWCSVLSFTPIGNLLTNCLNANIVIM